MNTDCAHSLDDQESADCNDMCLRTIESVRHCHVLAYMYELFAFAYHQMYADCIGLRLSDGRERPILSSLVITFDSNARYDMCLSL